MPCQVDFGISAWFSCCLLFREISHKNLVLQNIFFIWNFKDENFQNRSLKAGLKLWSWRAYHINLRFPQKIAKTFGQIWMILIKWCFKNLRAFILTFFRIQTTGTKGLKGFKTIPSNNTCWSMMFIPFFSNLIVKGSLVFYFRGIMWVRNMEGGYIKSSKIQTFSWNISKRSLNGPRKVL